VGIIESVGSPEFAKIIDSDGTVRKQQVEPLTNYFVLRIQKDFNKGNSTFGTVLTSTYRNLNVEELQFMNKTATVGGVDFRQYLLNRKFSFSGKYMVSHHTGTSQAILYQQTAPQRYFQRPNADYVSVDSNLTSLTGSYAYFDVARNKMQGLRNSLSVMYFSPSFEINDLGYLRNANNLMEIF